MKGGWLAGSGRGRQIPWLQVPAVAAASLLLEDRLDPLPPGLPAVRWRAAATPETERQPLTNLPLPGPGVPGPAPCLCCLPAIRHLPSAIGRLEPAPIYPPVIVHNRTGTAFPPRNIHIMVLSP